MNLRTYVRGPSGPGIWFFSLDAHRLAAVLAARLTYHLPYFWASMTVDVDGGQVDYYSSRGGRVKARIAVQVGDRLDRKDALAIFLTERYRLYTRYRRMVGCAAVEHPPWLLHQASALTLKENVRDAADLPHNAEEALVHYSPGVRVRIGRLKKVSP